MEWPRSSARDKAGNPIDNDEIPVELKNAVAEAAMRELTTPNSLLPDVTASALVKREQVGPISTEYFGDGGAAGTIPSVTIVEEFLSAILTHKGNVHFFKRG